MKTFRNLIRKEGYIARKVFNCAETGLSWKKMARRTYIAEEEALLVLDNTHSLNLEEDIVHE